MKYYAIARGRSIGVYTDWDEAKKLVERYPNAKYKGFSTMQGAESFIKQYQEDPIATPPSSSVTSSHASSHPSSLPSSHLSSLPSSHSFSPPSVIPLPISSSSASISSSISLSLSTPFSSTSSSTSPLFPVLDLNQSIPILVYTDGSFRDNLGGYAAVVLSDNDKYNIYGRVPLKQTNNVAELYAIYMTLSLIPNDDIVIYSDSQYSIKSLTVWIHTWMQNGWKTSTRKPVANQELVMDIYHLMGSRNIVFKHVLAHTGIDLNEEADTLANNGRLVEETLIITKNGHRIF